MISDELDFEFLRMFFDGNRLGVVEDSNVWIFFDFVQEIFFKYFSIVSILFGQETSVHSVWFEIAFGGDGLTFNIKAATKSDEIFGIRPGEMAGRGIDLIKRF